MNFITFILSIIFIKCHLAILINKEIFIDFHKSLSQIDISHTISGLKFVCSAPCKLILPKRIQKNVQISINSNNFTLIYEKSIDKNGNYTICPWNNSFVEYDPHPKCCPCCPWYYQSTCNRNMNNIKNCATFIIYSYFTRSNQNYKISFFDKTMILIPCTMRRSNSMENLKITSLQRPLKRFLHYNEGKLKFLMKDSQYNPTSGLCIKSSKLSKSIKCDYYKDDSLIIYEFSKINLYKNNINHSLSIGNDSNKQYLFISTNPTIIKLTKYQIIKLTCKSQYKYPKNLLICMKFEFSDKIDYIDFSCDKTSEILKKSLIIDASKINNKSKIICNITNPLRSEYKISETTIELIDKESLEIEDILKWNNKTRIINSNEKTIHFQFLFQSIPIDNSQNCELITNPKEKLNGFCGVMIIGECNCTINTGELFNRNITSKITIKISNSKRQKSFSLFLQPYLIDLKDHEIVVDFTRTIIQINIPDNTTNLKFICKKPCKLIIPKRIQSNIQISTNKNNLILIFDEKMDKNVNYTICPSNTSLAEFNQIPDCCPCCPWYNQSICKEYIDTRNCTTVEIYSIQKHLFNSETIYDNITFLLPCKMNRLNLEGNLTIIEVTYPRKMYLKYVNGNIEYIHKDLSYDPMLGLCFNSSIIKSSIKCDYSNEILIIYDFTKIDFEHIKIQHMLILLDRINNRNLIIFSNNSKIVLFKSQIIEIECNANYTNYANNLLICMKFEFSHKISLMDFSCEEVSKSFKKSLIIDASKLENPSKIICHITNPSRSEYKISELSISLVDYERLDIDNVQDWNNKIRKVYTNETIVNMKFSFNSIPTDNSQKCELFTNPNQELDGNCFVTIIGECQCLIKTGKLFIRKVQSQITIKISNKNIMKPISIFLKPIYLETPKLIGLSSLLEKSKRLQCHSEVSKPYNVTWVLEFTGKRFFHNQINDNKLIIPIYENNTICARCTVSNEIGLKTSPYICRDIVDIDINDDKPLQFFLNNVTIWNSTTKSSKTINSLTLPYYYIEVLDIKPLNLLCASRIRSRPIFFQLNNEKIQNVQQFSTKYTEQSKLEINVETLRKKNFSGLYICKQKLENDSQLESSMSLKILRAISPKIEAKFENHDSKSNFIIGQNVYLPFRISSFPPSKLELFKISVDNGNKFVEDKTRIKYEFSNDTDFKIHIVFVNISKVNAGTYLLSASNIINKTHLQFTIEAFESKTLKIYYLIAGVMVIVIICFFFLVRFIQKSGYAVPIIQIQNSMYKSLDIDSIQLLNIIWRDPLERKRWTIKPSSRIKIIKKIGEGNYGKIFKGSYVNYISFSEQFVALKQPILTNRISKGKQTGAIQFCQISLDCFMNEISVLSKLSDCPNIIKMIGCTVFDNGIDDEDSIKEPTTLLVLEYCSNKSLSEYLTKNCLIFSPYTKFRKVTELNGYAGMKLDEGITLLDLKKISLGIATGLDYLSGLNIIHRDLATRNILIDDQKIPKICDFGLAIELDNDVVLSTTYQILTHNKALPFKILAPEVLESRLFYLESDIWSFGLLLWQMFNLEQESLFPNFDNPVSLLKHIRSRLVTDEIKELLPVPKYADEPIWNLIKKCWVYESFKRSSAHKLRIDLIEIVRSSPVEVIRVSSCVPSDPSDPSYHDSVRSSKFPSTTTSIITLNYPNNSTVNNSENQNSYFFNEKPINESPL